jgi:hypothetical protein
MMDCLEKLLLRRQENLVAIIEKIALKSTDRFDAQRERCPAFDAQGTSDLNLINNLPRAQLNM